MIIEAPEYEYVGFRRESGELALLRVSQSANAQNEFLSNPKLGIGEDVWDHDLAAGKEFKEALTSGGQKGAIMTAAINIPELDYNGRMEDYSN